jgi:hypothetical protein
MSMGHAKVVTATSMEGEGAASMNRGETRIEMGTACKVMKSDISVTCPTNLNMGGAMGTGGSVDIMDNACQAMRSATRMNEDGNTSQVLISGMGMTGQASVDIEYDRGVTDAASLVEMCAACKARKSDRGVTCPASLDIGGAKGTEGTASMDEEGIDNMRGMKN